MPAARLLLLEWERKKEKKFSLLCGLKKDKVFSVNDKGASPWHSSAASSSDPRNGLALDAANRCNVGTGFALILTSMPRLPL